MAAIVKPLIGLMEAILGYYRPAIEAQEFRLDNIPPLIADGRRFVQSACLFNDGFVIDAKKGELDHPSTIVIQGGKAVIPTLMQGRFTISVEKGFVRLVSTFVVGCREPMVALFVRSWLAVDAEIGFVDQVPAVVVAPN